MQTLEYSELGSEDGSILDSDEMSLMSCDREIDGNDSLEVKSDEVVAIDRLDLIMLAKLSTDKVDRGAELTASDADDVI